MATPRPAAKSPSDILRRGEFARREVKRLEKAQAEVDKRRAQLEQQIRQAYATCGKHPLGLPGSRAAPADRFHRSQIFTTNSPLWQQINHQKYQPFTCRFGIFLLSKLRRGRLIRSIDCLPQIIALKGLLSTYSTRHKVYRQLACSLLWQKTVVHEPCRNPVHRLVQKSPTPITSACRQPLACFLPLKGEYERC